MKFLSLALKRRRLQQVNEHLFLLRDQRDSAIEGIRVYEGKARRLEEQISALESPRAVMRALLKRAM